MFVMVQTVLEVEDDMSQPEFEALLDVIENDTPKVRKAINLMAYDVTSQYEMYKAMADAQNNMLSRLND